MKTIRIASASINQKAARDCRRIFEKSKSAGK
jgi:hypothetical protein